MGIINKHQYCYSYYGCVTACPQMKYSDICFAHESATWLALGGHSPPWFHVLPPGGGSKAGSDAWLLAETLSLVHWLLWARKHSSGPSNGLGFLTQSGQVAGEPSERGESYLRPSLGSHMAATCHIHWPEQPQACPGSSRRGTDRECLDGSRRFWKTGNQKYCSDHLETIQTSTSAESEQAVPTYCPDLLMSPPPTLQLSFVPRGLSCLLEWHGVQTAAACPRGS